MRADERENEEIREWSDRGGLRNEVVPLGTRLGGLNLRSYSFKKKNAWLQVTHEAAFGAYLDGFPRNRLQDTPFIVLARSYGAINGITFGPSSSATTLLYPKLSPASLASTPACCSRLLVTPFWHPLCAFLGAPTTSILLSLVHWWGRAGRCSLSPCFSPYSPCFSPYSPVITRHRDRIQYAVYCIERTAHE